MLILDFLTKLTVSNLPSGSLLLFQHTSLLIIQSKFVEVIA